VSLLESISPTSRHLLRRHEALRARKERKQKSWLEELDTPVALLVPAPAPARKGVRALPQKGSGHAS